MNYSFVRGFGARGKSNEVHAGFPKVVTWARRQLLVKMEFFCLVLYVIRVLLWRLLLPYARQIDVLLFTARRYATASRE